MLRLEILVVRLFLYVSDARVRLVCDVVSFSVSKKDIRTFQRLSLLRVQPFELVLELLSL